MMSEKRFVLIEDDLEPLILDNKETMSVNEVVDLLNEQQATIFKLQDLCGKSDYENAKLLIENKKLKEEEKLYAQEILRLNELLKQYQSFKDLGGDY